MINFTLIINDDLTFIIIASQFSFLFLMAYFFVYSVCYSAMKEFPDEEILMIIAVI